MEKGLVDLAEGVTIDFEIGSTFARTGCTGELLVDGFDLADMGPEPMDKPKDVHEERRKKAERQEAKQREAEQRRERERQKRIAKWKNSEEYRERQRLAAMTSEERWNEKLVARLASKRRRLGEALSKTLD